MAMRAVTLAVLAILTAGAAPCRAEGEAQLLKDLYDARLGQLALLVKDVSEGKSRLLVGQVSSGGPKVGLISRSTEWGNMPFVSAYPVSEMFKAKLGGMGECVVLGAISLLVRAEAPGARESADAGKIAMSPPGVYLLAYTGELSDKEEESGHVSLMSVSVNKDGSPAFQQILGVQATRHTRPANASYGGEDWFGASVRFPNKDQVSDQNPAWRATVVLAAHEPDNRYRSYEFKLDLQVTME